MNEFAGAAILVVDDEAPARRLTIRVLESHGFRCSEACSKAEALETVAAAAPELVVTDMKMHGGSGASLIAALRTEHPDIAAVMVTGRDDAESADAALLGGAYGYVIKPFALNELLFTVTGALKRRALVLENRAHRDRLEALVRVRTRELDDSRAETVKRLARAVESRDAGTGMHVDRMSGLVYRLARALGWSDDDAETLRLASLLHDVGKIGIPDELLLKDGPLSADERLVIQTHASIGHGILAGADSELLRLADVIAWTHHERFDGSGYPRGLAKAEIPMPGRIAAVADVFDALTSDRPYRAALPEHEALATMRADCGLDPAVVDVLEAILRRGAHAHGAPG